MLAMHPEVEEETGPAGFEAAVYPVGDAFEPLRTEPLEVVRENLADELAGDVYLRLQLPGYGLVLILNTATGSTPAGRSWGRSTDPWLRRIQSLYPRVTKWRTPSRRWRSTSTTWCRWPVRRGSQQYLSHPLASIGRANQWNLRAYTIPRARPDPEAVDLHTRFRTSLSTTSTNKEGRTSGRVASGIVTADSHLRS